MRYFWMSEVIFVTDINIAVLVGTGWISHIDKSLQKKTNDLTTLHCQLSVSWFHPATQRMINSEGIN